MSSRSISYASQLATAIAVMATCGCQARQLGINYADKQASAVDNSWVTAVKSCWPDLAHGYADESLRQYLADPLHTRAAFSAYSSLNDADLRALVTKPVLSAPAPDASMFASSQLPVITRYQALYSKSNTLVSANNTDGAAPPDALCAVHSGTPVGFK